MRRRRQPNYSVNGERMPSKPGAFADARVKAIWTPAYHRAKAFYTKTHAPDPEQQARNSAWRAVKVNTEYPIAGRKGKRAVEFGAGPYTPIDPSSTTWFGKIIEVTFYDVSGRLHTINLTPQSDLIWDVPNNRIVVFPYLKTIRRVPVGNLGKAEQVAAAMYKEWHKRPPEEVQLSNPPLKPTYVMGTVDTISYRSDKWGKRNADPLLRGSPEYLHQVDDDVFIRTSNESRDGVPFVIVIEGGRLAATQAGIIH